MIDVVELGGCDLNLLLCLNFLNYLMFDMVSGWRFGVGSFPSDWVLFLCG